MLETIITHLLHELLLTHPNINRMPNGRQSKLAMSKLTKAVCAHVGWLIKSYMHMHPLRSLALIQVHIALNSKFPMFIKICNAGASGKFTFGLNISKLMKLPVDMDLSIHNFVHRMKGARLHRLRQWMRF